jgi:sugar/nucleoside kinase (ribokinase family)
VLRERGWQVLRVTSASWKKRRDDVIQQIFELVPGARGALQSDIWKKHRAALATPAASEKSALGKALPMRKPTAIPEAQEAVDEKPTPSPSEAQPTWALGIENPRFRKALLHLHTHGLLNETELVNLVGGPRQARAFALQLDEWLESLPFRVEVQQVGGAKIYRNVGPK